MPSHASPALALALLLFAAPERAAAQSVTRVEDFQARDLTDHASPFLVGKTGVGTAARYVDGVVIPMPGAGLARAVTPSGLTFAGTRSIGGALQAVRNLSGTGWFPIPDPPAGEPQFQVTTALDVSDDGQITVGSVLLDTPSGFVPRAQRWKSSGVVDVLLPTDLTGASSARCIAANRSRVGGRADLLGKPNTTAVYWDQSNVLHEVFPPGYPGVEQTTSSLEVFNNDGTLAAGTLGFATFRWSETEGVVLLPSHPELKLGMRPTAMSDDGQVIVGTQSYQVGPSWIWTPQFGTRLLTEIAAQLELDFGDSPQPFEIVSACSADGRRLVGWERQTADPNSPDDSWILDLPAGGVGEWKNLGHALPGSVTPELEAYGALAAGTPGRLRATHLTQFQTIGVFLGFSRVDAFFKGGTLVPAPDVLKFLPSLFGATSIPFTWPAGVPSGTSVYVQVWVPNSGGPSGYAASNAMRGTTP